MKITGASDEHLYLYNGLRASSDPEASSVAGFSTSFHLTEILLVLWLFIWGVIWGKHKIPAPFCISEHFFEVIFELLLWCFQTSTSLLSEEWKETGEICRLENVKSGWISSYLYVIRCLFVIDKQRFSICCSCYSFCTSQQIVCFTRLWLYCCFLIVLTTGGEQCHYSYSLPF